MAPWLRPAAPLAVALNVGMTLVTSACGSDGTGIDVGALEPDPALAFLVGDWTATHFEVTNDADPSIAPDIIALGATFTLNVQPSGQYTAISALAGQVLVEIGRVEFVENGRLVLHVQEPCCGSDPVDYALVGGHLTLRGPTEFDFNQDGEPEAAHAVITMVRAS